MRRCALPSLAVLHPFCAVLRFLVVLTRSETSLPKKAFHALPSLAVLDPFCAMLWFLITTYQVREQFAEKGFPRMRRCTLPRLLYLIPSAQCCGSSPYLPGQSPVRRKRLSTHAQMRTATHAILDPFCAVLRFLVVPTR